MFTRLEATALLTAGKLADQHLKPKQFRACKEDDQVSPNASRAGICQLSLGGQQTTST